MASPAWLPQEVQSSTSQDLASSPPTGESSVGTSSVGVPPIGSSSSVECPVIESPTLEGAIGARPDSTQDAARATFVNAPGYVLPPPSFSYKMPLNVNTTCGNSQLPSSSPVIKSNSTCSSSMLQPPVPSLSPGSAPSFSYNIARANVGFPGPPQFHPTMQNGSESSAPSVSQSSHTTSSSAIAVPSTPNLHPATPWMPTASSPQVPPVMSGTPAIRAPPEMASSVSIPSDVNVSSAYVGSSSAFLRPIVPAVPLPPNPGVQQQVYYASVPPMVAPPQGQWLRPPAVGGLPRPQFLTYPASFPVSFAPCDRAGMPLPSVALPDCQPPGVVPIGVPGRTPICSVSASNQSPVSSGMQPEVPPGVGNSKHIHNVDINHGVAGTEQQDAWTAHRTQTGAIYYYNALTGQSTYEKPAGFKGEPDKVAAQPTPVLCERLGGTDWEVITTNDGKKYYHNTKTKLTSWQIPSEVTELKKKQDGDSSKEQPMSVSNTNLLTEKGTAPITLSVPAVNTGGRDATTLRASGQPNSSSALDLIKKKLQESGYTPSSPIPALSVPLTSELLGPRATEPTVKTPQSENSKDKAKVANGEGNLSDSSSDSEDVDSGPTKEECIKQFKEMLKERGVAPFSKWEKELPKIVFDPRFKAIPSHSARRSLFDHYVRTRAEEERKEKRAAQKAAIEGFKQLLEEAKEDINHNTDYQSFKKKWGHDLRFEALDRKERETLLNERVYPLKKAEHERAQAMHAAAASSFKSMLQDKGNITTSSRWSKVKDGLRHDPRYKSVKHEDREALFNEYVSELKVAEEEAERAEKAKRGEEEKLKERERSLRKRKEREEQEVERVRSKARRKEAVESYQALLVEIIKDPQASWTDSKPKLEKDPQGRAANPSLDQSDLEKLFREHVKILHERCANDFRALLAEAITPESGAQETEEGKTAITSWSTAKHVLKDDPRYAKMPKKNREALWRRHVEEMQRRHAESRSRSSVDSGKHISGSKRTHERR